MSYPALVARGFVEAAAEEEEGGGADGGGSGTAARRFSLYRTGIRAAVKCLKYNFIRRFCILRSPRGEPPFPAPLSGIMLNSRSCC